MYKDKNDPRNAKSKTKWYEKNKELHMVRKKERRDKLMTILKRLKGFLKCTDCGIAFKGRTEICDFHHINPTSKEGRMTQVVTYGKKKLKEELKKCIPLCANCHRTRHAMEI